jgi:hypothetical protein
LVDTDSGEASLIVVHTNQIRYFDKVTALKPLDIMLPTDSVWNQAYLCIISKHRFSVCPWSERSSTGELALPIAHHATYSVPEVLVFLMAFKSSCHGTFLRQSSELAPAFSSPQLRALETVNHLHNH